MDGCVVLPGGRWPNKAASDDDEGPMADIYEQTQLLGPDAGRMVLPRLAPSFQIKVFLPNTAVPFLVKVHVLWRLKREGAGGGGGGAGAGGG